MSDSATSRFSLRSFFTGLLPLFVLAHCAHHIINSLTVPLLPMIREDFALTYTQAGFIASAFSIAYGIGQLPSGWLADRIGARIMITIGIVGVAASGLLVGLSQTYIMVVIFMVLMGIAGGGYHPSATPMISASVAPEKRGRALGIHLIGGGISFFLSPLIAAAIATVWGWRGAYLTLSIPTIIFGIIFYMLLKRVQAARGARRETTITPVKTPPVPGERRRLVVIIILNTIIQATYLSIVTYIPLFLVDNFGISKEAAASMMALVYSGGLWASPLGGYLSDRVGRLPVILTVCFITGPFIYLLNMVPHGIAFGAFLVVFGMVQAMRMPVSEAYVVDHTPESKRSTIMGIYYFGNIEVGGLLTPAVGYLIDRFGFFTSFSITGAAMLAVSLLCSVFLWNRWDQPPGFSKGTANRL